MSASSQLCTFHLDDLFLGVDVGEVQEVIRSQPMTDVPLAPDVVRGLINLRGQIVAAIDLRTRFGLPARPDGQEPMNVVLRREDGPVSLLVDDIGDVVEVDPAAYQPPPPTLHGIPRQLVAGTHPLPGRLLLVLDAERALDVDAELTHD